MGWRYFSEPILGSVVSLHAKGLSKNDFGAYLGFKERIHIGTIIPSPLPLHLYYLKGPLKIWEEGAVDLFAVS